MLVAWGVKRAADAFNRIPNLNAEERLMRMADFAAEALERAKAMPDGPRKDKEIARVTALIADVDAKRAKVEAAERKRREWSRRVMRVDEDGVSVRSKREAARRERRAPASARRARRAASDGDGDGDGDARDSSAADPSAAIPPTPTTPNWRGAGGNETPGTIGDGAGAVAGARAPPARARVG